MRACAITSTRANLLGSSKTRPLIHRKAKCGETSLRCSRSKLNGAKVESRCRIARPPARHALHTRFGRGDRVVGLHWIWRDFRRLIASILGVVTRILRARGEHLYASRHPRSMVRWLLANNHRNGSHALDRGDCARPAPRFLAVGTGAALPSIPLCWRLCFGTSICN